MRKWMMLSLFAAATLGASAQDTTANKTLRAATTKICDCLNGKASTTKSMADMQSAATECITNSALTEFMALAEERGVDLTSEDAGRKLGMEVAMDLVKMKCPAYMEIARRAAQGQFKDNGAGEDVPPSENRLNDMSSVGGTVLRVDKGDVLTLTIRDNKGSEQKYYWLDRFPGSESFSATQIDKLKGSKVIVKWTEKELYQPGSGAYKKVRVIRGLD
ncbi:MAG: hypothetical protein EOO16_16310 [Chitinophagaceae bacterium]|nr:MAG: hypothetical protein EOO16_16310 [Chitinophagaceae bacterium]